MLPVASTRSSQFNCQVFVVKRGANLRDPMPRAQTGTAHLLKLLNNLTRLGLLPRSCTGHPATVNKKRIVFPRGFGFFDFRERLVKLARSNVETYLPGSAKCWPEFV